MKIEKIGKKALIGGLGVSILLSSGVTSASASTEGVVNNTETIAVGEAGVNGVHTDVTGIVMNDKLNNMLDTREVVRNGVKLDTSKQRYATNALGVVQPTLEGNILRAKSVSKVYPYTTKMKQGLLDYNGIKVNYDNFLEYAILYQILGINSTLSLSNMTGVTVDVLAQAVNKVYMQNPLLGDFKGYTYRYNTKTKLVTSVEFKYIINIDDIQSRREAIPEAILEIEDAVKTKGVSAQTMLNRLYAWMDKNVSYNSDAAYLINKYGIQSPEASMVTKYYSPYGVAIDHTGTCQSYAGVTKILLDRMGVENYVVLGDYKKDEHAWNIVDIGSKTKKFYNYDFVMTYKSAGVPYGSYRLTDAQMIKYGYKKKTGWEKEEVEAVVKTPKTEIDVYTKNKYIVKDKKELESYLYKKLKGSKKNSHYFRVKDSISMKTITSVTQKAVIKAKRKDLGKTVYVKKNGDRYSIVIIKN